MGFFDNLRKQAASQFIEVVEWLDDSSDTIVYRFPVFNQEIKMGAQLTVRENQLALFVNEGQAADLFQPGLHTLSTQNIPILTTLRGWKHGFSRRSRRRSTSSTRGSSPTSSGGRRTR